MTVTLASSSENPNFLRQLRLFLEEICCDICRCTPSSTTACRPRKSMWPVRSTWARRARSPTCWCVGRGRPPYFLEVKYGYASDRLVHHLQHKYGTASTTVPDADRVVLLIDRATRPDSSALFARPARRHPS